MFLQRQEHKILREHLKKTGENTEVRFIIQGNKLIIGNREYTAKTLRNTVIKRPNSEPFTRTIKKDKE